MCIDYQKLNKETKKDHFPLPFIDEMLERLAKHSFFGHQDGSGFGDSQNTHQGNKRKNALQAVLTTHR